MSDRREPTNLRQYVPSEPLALTSAQLERLVTDYAKRVTVQPAGPSLFSLVAGSHVGVIRLDDLDILVEPKIPPLSVFWMLGYAHRIARFDVRDFPFASEAGLLELLARLFASETASLIRRGLYRTYVEREENLTVVRGRLSVLTDVIQNRGLRHRAVCRFEELTADLVINRALWFATQLLGRFEVRAPQIEQQLAWNLMHLSDVEPQAVELAAIDRITYNRLNDHYRPAVGLARLVIANSVFRYAGGEQPGPGFLLDMDKVYEEFLTELFVGEGRDLGLSPRSTGNLYLDKQRDVPIDPDILLADGAGRLVVVDAKYKRQDKTADVYQALAYAKALGVSSVALVYPEDGEVTPTDHQIRNDKVVIKVRTVPVGRGTDGYQQLDQRARASARRILSELGVGKEATQAA